MSIQPYHDRIVVERLESEKTSAGGIVIPDSAKEKPQQGKVVAVGTGKVLENGEFRPIDIKAGDTVLFGKYAGTEVQYDGADYLVIREEDVMGTIA